MIFDPDTIPFKETHKLMIGSIVPRPIAFVSTASKDGKKGARQASQRWPRQCLPSGDSPGSSQAVDGH